MTFRLNFEVMGGDRRVMSRKSQEEKSHSEMGGFAHYFSDFLIQFSRTMELCDKAPIKPLKRLTGLCLAQAPR
jgi:hypothetical protein